MKCAGTYQVPTMYAAKYLYCMFYKPHMHEVEIVGFFHVAK